MKFVISSLSDYIYIVCWTLVVNTEMWVKRYKVCAVQHKEEKKHKIENAKNEVYSSGRKEYSVERQVGTTSAKK